MGVVYLPDGCSVQRLSSLAHRRHPSPLLVHRPSLIKSETRSWRQRRSMHRTSENRNQLHPDVLIRYLASGWPCYCVICDSFIYVSVGANTISRCSTHNPTGTTVATSVFSKWTAISGHSIFVLIHILFISDLVHHRLFFCDWKETTTILEPGQ